MVQTTLRLPDELHRMIKKEARSRGMTVNGLIVMLLWNSVRR